MKVSRRCPCGQVFQTVPSRVRDGKGRFCSRACMYRFRRRSSTEFKRGHPGTGPNRGQFTSDQAGPSHPLWKGDRAGYRALHQWVARHRTKTGRCSECGAEGRTEWANRSHEYRRDLDDWVELCKPCHTAYDREHQGAMEARFG